MAEVVETVSAPSAGATETVTAPAPPASEAPASAPAPSPSAEPAFETTEDLLAALNAGPTATDAEKSEPADTKAEETAAPEEGQTSEETKDETTEAEAAASIRQLIKSSNLPTDQKALITDLAYKAKAWDETGFTLDQVKQLKEYGLTAESALERIRVHPSIEDVQRDATLARDMREFVNDYQTNPGTAAKRLYETNQQMFRPFAAEIIRNASVIDPDLYIEQQSTGFRTALQRIATESARSGNAEVQAFAEGVLEYVYGNPTGQPTAPDPNNPLVRENRELKERIAREEQQRTQGEQTARAQFGNAMRDNGAALIMSEVKSWVGKLKPAGMDDDLASQVADQVFNGVAQDLLQNRSVMSDMELYTRGPLTRENFERAMAHIKRTVGSYIPIHMKPALERWSKYISPRATTPQSPAKPKPRPDVGRVPGAPSTPTVKPMHEQVLDEAQAKGLTDLETLQLMNARMAASQ